MDEFTAITLGGAVLTYATRAGGYLLLSRLRTVPPRVAAGLDAVPAAVLTALSAPAFVSGTWREALVMCVAALLSLRAGLLTVLGVSLSLLFVLRMV